MGGEKPFMGGASEGLARERGQGVSRVVRYRGASTHGFVLRMLKVEKPEKEDWMVRVW